MGGERVSVSFQLVFVTWKVGTIQMEGARYHDEWYTWPG